MNHPASLAMPPPMCLVTCYTRRRILHPVYSWSRTLGMMVQAAQRIRCKTSRPRDSRLHTGRTSLSGTQLIEQRLCLFQIGSVEAFGEPVVDVGEHGARLVALALRREQPGETRRRAQLQELGTDLV
jgi:hypothetical protein